MNRPTIGNPLFALACTAFGLSARDVLNCPECGAAQTPRV